MRYYCEHILTCENYRDFYCFSNTLENHTWPCTWESKKIYANISEFELKMRKALKNDNMSEL